MGMTNLALHKQCLRLPYCLYRTGHVEKVCREHGILIKVKKVDRSLVIESRPRCGIRGGNGWPLKDGGCQRGRTRHYLCTHSEALRNPWGGSEIAERWSLKMGPRGKSKGRTSLRRVK